MVGSIVVLGFAMMVMLTESNREASVNIAITDANGRPIPLGWVELVYTGPDEWRQEASIDDNGHSLLGGTMLMGRYQLKIWSSDQKLEGELLYETVVNVRSGEQKWPIRLQQVSQQIKMVVAGSKDELDKAIPPRDRHVEILTLEKYQSSR